MISGAKGLGRDRKAVIGISMGGRQALSLVLTNGGRGFSALGVLSGKLQNHYKADLETFVGHNYRQTSHQVFGCIFITVVRVVATLNFTATTKVPVRSWVVSYDRIHKVNTTGGGGDRKSPSSFGYFSWRRRRPPDLVEGFGAVQTRTIQSRKNGTLARKTLHDCQRLSTEVG
jgi:hypothetical protein